MKTFKVGIVGCGNIFPMHAYPVNALDNTVIKAVCDIKEDRAMEKAKVFNCHSYVDYKEMIEKEDLDVIHICTPHYLHPPIMLYAAKAGLHVMTEKPMSIDFKDAKAMVEAAKENNVTLGVIFQNRYNPGSVLIKQTLASGELGNIISGKCSVTWDRSDSYYTNSDWKGTWDKEGGGVIIDQAIHTLDLMRWFVDSDLDYVDANISNRAHEIIEVEDSAEGVIKFKNGVITSFHAINYYGYDAPVEIELYCEKGIVKLQADTSIIRFNNGKEIKTKNNPNEIFSYGDVKTYWGVSHVKQINNYYQSLTDNKNPAITGEEAMKTQKMVCAIYDSGKQGKRIQFN